MRKIKRRWLVVSPTLVLLVLISGFEFWHLLNAGHLVPYGTHTHLLRDPADIGIPGIKSMYALDLFNYGLIPITLNGCKRPSDVSPYYQIIYRYQVEKWDSNQKDWKQLISLKPSDCPKEFIVSRTLWPGQSVGIIDWEATAATDGFVIGDSARFVAYALFDSADDASGQVVFISNTFPIEEQVADRSIQYRIKH